MHFALPTGHRRRLLSMAALALLALLLLSPGEVQGQNAPTITAGPTSKSVAENTATTEELGACTATDSDAGDVLSWSLDGNDADDFDISSDGKLTFSAEPDFEMPADTGSENVYNVTVKVSDDEMTPMTATRDVTVTNVDEDGTVSISGTLEGGVELTASVTDPDGSVTGTTWQWSSGESANGTFTNIMGATSDKYTSVAADVNMFLKATATYKDAESTTVDKTAEAVTTSAIAASNTKPTFDEGASTTREVPENSSTETNSTETNVGAVVEASDADASPADTLTYGLKNTGDHSSFTIVSTSGQIQTKSG